MDKVLGPLPTRGLAREELSPARRAALDALIDLGGRRSVAELAEELGQHPNTVREHLEALVRAGLTERTLRHSVGRGRPAALFRATLAATPAGPEYAVLAEVLINYLARLVPDDEERVQHALAAGHDWGRAIRERHLVDAPRAERRATHGLPTAPSPTAESREPSDSRVPRDSRLSSDSRVPRDSSPFIESRAPDGGAMRAGNSALGDGVGAAGRVDGLTDSGEGLADSVGRLGEMFDRAGFDCHTIADDDGGYTQRLRRCPVLALAREHPDVVCTSHLGMAQEILGHEGISPERVTLEAFAEPGACLLRVAPPTAGHE